MELEAKPKKFNVVEKLIVTQLFSEEPPVEEEDGVTCPLWRPFNTTASMNIYLSPKLQKFAE